jgi:streptomycin 6-kinase
MSASADRVPAVPPELAQRITDLFGATGESWIAELPAALVRWNARWHMTLHPPFPDLTYHYVAPASGPEGEQWVLKAGVPNPELEREIDALEWYDGHGMVRLVDGDADEGVMLLDRVLPGTPLRTLDDDEAATRIAAQVMQSYWRPPPDQLRFPSVRRWAAGLGELRAFYGGGTGPLPEPLVTQAEWLFTELANSMAPPVLLHGDLHHDNILGAGGGRWLALDPKGFVGEPACEIAAFLRNPPGRLQSVANPKEVLARRVAVFEEMLGVDRNRIVGWGIAVSVLCAWWSLQDHGSGYEGALACAGWLTELL